MKERRYSKSLTDLRFGAYGWLLILVCAIMMMMNSTFTTDGQNVFVPYLSGALNIDANVLLAMGTPIGWISCIATIYLSHLVYKKGARLISLVFCIISAVCIAAFGLLVKNVWSYFILLLLIQTCTRCLSSSVHYAYVGVWFPKKKGIVMGWSTMGLPAASLIIVPILTVAVEKGSVGFTWFCALMGVVCVLIGVLTYLLLPNAPEQKGLYPDNMKPEVVVSGLDSADLMHHFESRYTIPSLLKNKDLWLICLGFGLPWLSTAGVMSQVIPRLMDTGKFASVMNAVAVLQVATVVGLFGSYFWGWLDAKIGTKKTGIAFNIWYVLAFIVLIFLDRFPVAISYVAVCCVTFGAGGIANIMPSMVITKFGRFESVSANRVANPLVGMVASCAFALLAVGKAIGGWIGCYGIFVVACIVGAVLVAFIDDTCAVDDTAIEQELIAKVRNENTGK